MKMKRFLSFLLIISLLGIGGVSAAETQASAQPVAYWDFEDVSGTTVSDKSGNGYDGVLCGNATVTAGKFGNAVKFSSAGDFVKIPLTAEKTMNFTSTESYTISMWVKPEALSENSGWQCVFNKGSQQTEGRNLGFWFNKEYFHYAQLSGKTYANSTLTATNNVWWKVSLVQDGANNKAYLYVNGDVAITLDQSLDATQKNASSNMLLGAKDTSGTETFKGMVDEIKIYRTAMSAADVKKEYDDEVAVANASEKIVASWNFENVSETSVPDNTGNNHNGTLGGNAEIKGNGKIGKAVDLSPAGVLTVAHGSDFEFGATASYTISLWIKANNVTGNQCIFAKGSTNGLALYLNDGVLSLTWGTSTQTVTGTLLSPDEWYHICIAQDNDTGKIKLYVDGASVLENTSGSASNTADWCFGSLGENSFDGWLDDICVYNYALTDAEISSNYTQTETTYPDYAKFTGEWPTIEDGEIPNVIIDTDIGGDSDDLGAMAVFYYFAQQGKLNPLAAISCEWKYSASMLRALGTYYGYPDVPVAARGNAFPKTFDYGKYITAHFETDIVDNQNVIHPKKLYRKILSEAEDNSVTIVTVGNLQNVYELLASTADEYSTLTGKELVAKKVKRLVTMGGKFPEGRETNLKNSAARTRYVNLYWPTPILYCGWEIANEMYTATRLDEMGGYDNPVSAGYRAYFLNHSKVENYKRPSWDPLTVYVTIEGWDQYFDLCRGDVAIKVTGDNTTDGYNTFYPNEKTGARAYLKFKEGHTQSEVATVLDQILVDAEKRNKAEVRYTYVDNTDASITKTSTVSTDTRWATAECFDNSYYLSEDIGATIEYTFNGSGILAYGTFGRAYGKIDVYIDGTKRTTVDLYRNANDFSGCLFAIEDLNMGEHTVKMVTSSEKNASSTGYNVMLDFFKVRGGYNYLTEFETGDGSKVKNVSTAANAALVEPTEPTRTGYHFGGWFAGDTAYDFSSAVNAPLTLTAKWLEKGKTDVSVTPNKAYIVSGDENVTAYAASYKGNALIDAKTETVSEYKVIKFDEIEIDTSIADDASLFILNEKLKPLCGKIDLK